MSPPDGVMEENLQRNCEGLLCLVVDERFKVGSYTLGWDGIHDKIWYEKCFRAIGEEYLLSFPW